MLVGDVLRQLSGVLRLANAAETEVVSRCRLVLPDEVGPRFEADREEVVLIADPQPSRDLVQRVLQAGPGLAIFKSPEPAVWPPGQWVLIEESVPWDRVLRILDQILMTANRLELENRVDRGRDMGDLYALATDLSQRVPGLVTIDDATSNLLAFSPLDETADDLRRASVFGRGAPEGHVEELARSGLWRQLTREQSVLHIPKSRLVQERLVVGIFEQTQNVWIGTIWVQRGHLPFSDSAGEELLAGAFIAARLMSQNHRRSIERQADMRALLGLSPGRFSPIPSRQRRVDRSCRLAVFAAGGGGPWPNQQLIALEVRATRLSRGSQVVQHGEVVYVFLPGAGDEDRLEAWATEATQSLATSLEVSAAVAATSVDKVEATRRDLEDLLYLVCVPRGLTSHGLTRSRASLETARAIRHASLGMGIGRELADQLEVAGAGRKGELLNSARAYFEGGGDFVVAAQRLHIHPNTLRQRLRRVESLTGLSMSNADDRFYLEMQVRALNVAPEHGHKG